MSDMWQPLETLPQENTHCGYMWLFDDTENGYGVAVWCHETEAWWFEGERDFTDLWTHWMIPIKYSRVNVPALIEAFKKAEVKSFQDSIEEEDR